MKKLTSKNYENLPEVKKKKEEEKKRLELMERKAATKDYLQELERVRLIFTKTQKRKAMMSKKKKQEEENL